MNGPLRESSAAFGDCASHRKDTSMLARRFTIVCLLLTLFSMFFASIVAHGRSERSWQPNAGIACLFEQSANCL
jgi:hypothetical protein